MTNVLMNKPTARSNAEELAKRSSHKLAEVLAALDAPNSRVKAALAETIISPATICLQLQTTFPPFVFAESGTISSVPDSSSSSPTPTVMKILLTLNLASYPFDVLDGSISGDIYTFPTTIWKPVPGLQLGGADINLEFERVLSFVTLGAAAPLNSTPSLAETRLFGAGPRRIRIGGYALYTSPSEPKYSPLSGSVYNSWYLFDDVEPFYPSKMLLKGWQS